MAETPLTGAHRASVRRAPEEPTRSVGWVLFAAIMLLLVGLYQALTGLVALFEDNYFVVPKNNLVVHVDYTAWGWTHLVIGLAALVAAFGVMFAKDWARYLGIGLAVVSAVVNLMFIRAYPVWGVIAITLDVLVIYALAVHGPDVSEIE
jgi:hypothetical protein